MYHFFLQKRKERESAVQKNGKLTEQQKMKWLKVMDNVYMSSEDSGEEDRFHGCSLFALEVYMR